MSFSDFTSLYGTTEKAKFWCDYMTGLRGQLQALEVSRTRESPSVWCRVSSSEVPDPPEIRLPYCPVHSKIYGNTASRTSRIS